MKRVALCCPAIHERIDVTYGLRKLSRFAFRQRPELAAELMIDIVPLKVTEPQEQAVDKLLERDPDLIGLSTFIWNVKDNLELARGIKERSPRTRVVFGGPQVSDPQWNILDHTDLVDLVVRGEGEATFAEVLRLWLGTGQLCSPSLAGISYHNGGETLHNPDRPLILDLDDIPPIYTGFEARPKVLYGLETTRGCYQRCGYCAMGLMPFRKHSLEYVLEEVDAMAAAGIRQINLLDSSFTFYPRRNIPIARRLGELGIRFICCGKAEEMSADLIDVLIDSGMLKIEFGLQAVHPETLRLMGRRMKKELFEENVRALLEKCRGTDVEVAIDVISGLPGDDLESFKETLDFAYSLRPHSVAAFPLQLLPATEFFRRSEELGIEHMPVTEPDLLEHGRYNLHKHGLVTQNRTFSRQEVEAGRRICLLNGFILQAHLTDLVYQILEMEGLRFSTWLERLAAYLQPGIYSELERMNTDPSVVRQIWLGFCQAMADYAHGGALPAARSLIIERFPEAKRTA